MDATQKDRMLEMLCRGMPVTQACRELGITRQAYYRERRKDAAFAERCDIILAGREGLRRTSAAQERVPETSPEPEEEEEWPAPYRGADVGELTTRSAEDLREALKAAHLYSRRLEPQILAAAHTWAMYLTTQAEVYRYAPMQKEISREGNVKLACNPGIARLESLLEKYTVQLRALGLNYDSKAQETAPSGREAFFRMFEQNDDPDEDDD